MAIEVNYNKRKNSHIFSKFMSGNNLNLDTVQNYIPIYDRFFSLNTNNFNSINFNHKLFIIDIKDNKNTDDDHVFNCKLQHIVDENYTINTKIFIKMAPLLDPFKYLVGKYNHTDPNLFSLPTYDKTNGSHVKINNPNNSAYIDGFFSYLSSQMLHQHNFIHGLDFYGSFLAIKNDYDINVIDDIDYLIQSEFFLKQQNTLFKVEDYSHLISNTFDSKVKPINISSSLKSNLSIKSINDDIFENIFEKKEEMVPLTLDDIKNSKLDLIDITNTPNNQFNDVVTTHNETLKSGSSCSSRTSHTNDDDVSDTGSEDEDNSVAGSGNDESVSDYESVIDPNTFENNSIEEEKLLLTFPKFPIQLICMEKCDNTFDDLILTDKLSQDEWFSALTQIIMILLVYQKTFAFTHNDLHSNNIMYSETNKKYIYYTYKKNTYKVPTFGKLYKIIDFGRAIYKYKGKIFCSDSFQLGGDASTQYNTEPYFNDKKPRLEPNFSFDLCRLACSIFDYVVEDMDDIKNINACSPLVKLIVDWCIDDNGINVLYKNNGAERYPDFKLYKMIARHVHKHTPQNQLERDEFKKYKINSKNIPKNEVVINIDDYPSYI